jgi:hypothetical protein
MNIRRRYAFIIALALAVSLYEVGMRTFFSVPFAYFFPGLGIICLGLFRGWNEEAFVFAFILGGMHDVFRFQQTFLFAGFPVLVAVLRFISLNVMTNRSLYSVIALTVLGRLCLWIWETSMHWMGSWFMPMQVLGIPWSELWQRIAWDAFFVALCFLFPFVFRRLFGLRRKSAHTYGSLI